MVVMVEERYEWKIDAIEERLAIATVAEAVQKLQSKFTHWKDRDSTCRVSGTRGSNHIRTRLRVNSSMHHTHH